MTFDKKTIITIAASVAGVIVLGGIIGLAAHTRHYNNRFEGKFGNAGCGIFAEGKQAEMMSGLENIITTKDYTAFQTLFSGSKMLEQINTPEKFATRVELQTAMKTVQDLEAKLGSGSNAGFNPMMLDEKNMMGNDRQGRNGGGSARNENMRKRGGMVGCY
ncbi:MAG: hypothetical protein WC606_01225 [Candidatus Absconditabacterales bacterium]